MAVKLIFLFILQPIYFSDGCLCYRCPPLSRLYVLRKSTNFYLGHVSEIWRTLNIVGALLQTPIHHFGNQFVFRPNTRWRDGVTFIVTFNTDIAAVEITVFMRT